MKGKSKIPPNSAIGELVPVEKWYSGSMYTHYGGAKMQHSDILKELKSLSNPKAIEGMAKHGITPESICGVSIPNLRKS